MPRGCYCSIPLFAGQEVTSGTARQLVLYHRRSGGQSQFSSLFGIEGADRSFGPLLAWAREHLDAPLTVKDLAEQAGMSSRHFTRAFIAETGTTPSKAVERLRIEVARQRVQSTGEAIERVAQSTGFRDPERMRRAFIRAFGQPPQSLRPCGKGRVALFCQPPLCWFAWTALSKSLCQAGLPGSPGATNPGLSLLAAGSDA